MTPDIARSTPTSHLQTALLKNSPNHCKIYFAHSCDLLESPPNPKHHTGETITLSDILATQSRGKNKDAH